MSVTKGMCLYSIEKNGCLNGVFVNENGKISNEILKLTEQQGEDKICGKYIASWVENGSIVNDKNVTIEKENNVTIEKKTDGSYEFKWGEVFTGFGYKMNDRQIAVHYKSN